MLYLLINYKILFHFLENSFFLNMKEENKKFLGNFWKSFNERLGHNMLQYSSTLTTSISFQTRSQQFVNTPIATSVYGKRLKSGENTIQTTL